jgi:anthranilate synthase component II
MILVIDNYDSFTYNIVQYLGELKQEVCVYRNDKITLNEIEELHPDYLLISPGPCDPPLAGISVEAIQHFAGKIPILGVCLGHQSMGYAFGGEIIRAKKLMHGKTSTISHDGKGVFTNLPQDLTAIRYHSLVINRDKLPECLEITSESEDGEIMGVRHKTLPLEGIQFHPESVLTQHGHAMLQNFLDGYK